MYVAGIRRLRVQVTLEPRRLLDPLELALQALWGLTKREYLTKVVHALRCWNTSLLSDFKKTWQSSHGWYMIHIIRAWGIVFFQPSISITSHAVRLLKNVRAVQFLFALAFIYFTAEQFWPRRTNFFHDSSSHKTKTENFFLIILSGFIICVYIYEYHRLFPYIPIICNVQMRKLALLLPQTFPLNTLSTSMIFFS